jgi:hypothetical protein
MIQLIRCIHEPYHGLVEQPLQQLGQDTLLYQVRDQGVLVLELAMALVIAMATP